MKTKEKQKQNAARAASKRWRSKRHAVRVWLSESEFFALAQHADASGETLAGFVKQRALEAKS
ncbi:hypothetical protein GCM10027285_10870 [Oleiagrimonas citrea]|uniref:Uncharacterized protein n=1 Tax=Oleiagrimonas citrea TaxID=1665687 RepID=A0A846ZKN2_9GAMM|nr:hypothetical protein [Oleiagrimonas citrea]NKZ38352.1 hypothetical protein [Oleiagrimonas citrea]